MAIGGFPLAWIATGRRIDISAFLAFPLGSLLTGYMAWLLGMAGVLPFSSEGCWAAFFIGSIIAWTVAIRSGLSLSHLRSSLSSPVISAAAYITSLALWAAVRGLDPSTMSTEKPMDMAFLSSLMRTQVLPPPDPWLAGYPINYYYLGYLLAATQAELAGVPNGVAFNLAISNYFALSVCSFAAAGLALGPQILRFRWLSSLVTVVVTLMCGNLFTAVQLIQRPMWVLSTDWWQGVGWNATRVIADTLPSGPWPNISEFPIFSFLLGDMHPHVMALPYVGALATAVVLVVQDTGRDVLRWAGITWLLGSLYPLNSWDFPTLMVTVTLISSVINRPSGNIWAEVALFRVGILTAGGILAYLPFWLTFRPPVAGPGAPLPPELVRLPLVPTLSRYFGLVVWDHTSLEAFITVNGVFLVPTLTWLIWHFMRPLATEPSKLLLRLGIGFLAIGAGPAVGIPILGLLAILIVLAGVAFLDKRLSAKDRTIGGFALVAGLLFLFCEFIFIQDVFHNRMNTIFKFYYQAWALLGIAASAVVARWLAALLPHPTLMHGPSASVLQSQHDHRLRFGTGNLESSIGLSLAALVVLMGLTYPALAVPKKLGGQGWRGLDATEWIRTNRPDEWRVMEWLSRNAEAGSTVLEAVGNAYSYAARISTYTGIPTVLGWANHERQWHAGDSQLLAELAVRERDVDNFYRGTDLDVPERYGTKYIVYGELEQGRIDPNIRYVGQLEKLRSRYQLEFQAGGVFVFRTMD